MDAAAGSLTAAADGITIDDCEQLPVIKAFARYDFTIFARGDSMFPEYHSGDELACLYVKNTTFIQWGCCHVLDTVQGIVVKRIYDDGEYILCKSENSELFKDFRIHKTEVYNIALVIGLVRRY
jgi:phage repressor protein C with HTH and peptisase S24 domain